MKGPAEVPVGRRRLSGGFIVAAVHVGLQNIHSMSYMALSHLPNIILEDL